jgi:hypothetical protein
MRLLHLGRLPIVVRRINLPGLVLWRVVMQKRADRRSALNDLASHLLHNASQRADGPFAKEAGDADVAPRQFALLIAVGELDEPSQTDLVEATGIDRSTLADIVRRMMQRGLLERRRSRGLSSCG